MDTVYCSGIIVPLGLGCQLRPATSAAVNRRGKDDERDGNAPGASTIKVSCSRRRPPRLASIGRLVPVVCRL
jgi:hypothetical protein